MKIKTILFAILALNFYQISFAQTASELNESGLKKYDSQNFSDAINDFDKAIQIDPKNPEFYFNRANAKANLDKDQEAINDYNQAISLNPNYYQAYYERGDTKVGISDYEGSLKDFTSAIEINPKYAEAYYYRGYIKSSLKREKEAIEDFTEAIKLEYLDAYLKRGISKYRLGDLQDAESDFTKSIEFDPKSIEAYELRGFARNKLGNFEKAIEDFSKMIELGEVSAHYGRGVLWGKLGKSKEAIEDYSKVIETDPQNGLAYNNRADERNNIEDFAGAIEDATIAIKLMPDSYYPYYCRGYAKCNLGNSDGCNDLMKAVKLGDPTQEIQDVIQQFCKKNNSEKDYVALGKEKADLGDYKGAVSLYTKAIKNDPKNVPAYYFRAMANFNLKKYADAIPDFSKVIEFSPEETNAYYRRACSYAGLEKYDLAMPDLNKTIELDPKFSLAYILRGTIHHPKNKEACCADLSKAKELGDKNADKYYVQYCGNEQKKGESLMLYWPEDEMWRMASNQETPEMDMIELLRNNETFENWTEIGTMQSIKGATGISMDEAKKMMVDQTKKDCPDAKITVIEKNETTEFPWIIFSLECTTHKSSGTAESQVWYIVQGKDALYLNFRAIKAGTIPEETKTKWVNFFKTGKIVYK